MSPTATAADYKAFLRRFHPAIGDDTLAPLPTRAATTTGAGLALYPNPAGADQGATWCGSLPGAAVLVLDALGRRVAAATADASGTAALPAGLAPGLYVVRSGGAAVRLMVE